MSPINRTWDLLSKEERAGATRKIMEYFSTERQEELGVIAAESVLDFFLEHLGPILYNAGVDRAKQTMQVGFENVSVEIDLLHQK